MASRRAWDDDSTWGKVKDYILPNPQEWGIDKASYAPHLPIPSSSSIALPSMPRPPCGRCPLILRDVQSVANG